MNKLRVVFIIIGLAILTTLMGCAKFPTTAPKSGKQIVFTLKVRGTISPIDSVDPTIQRHYFIAIDNDGDQNTGPWAAIAPPYGGNGWVTSNDAKDSIGLTSFVRYDSANPEGYIYNVLSGSYFLNVSSPQIPISAEITDGGSTLRVVVDFSQIATTGIPTDDIKQLDVNFITTNALPLNGEYVAGRIWDGLGPSGQNYVNVDTTADNFYSGENEDGPSVSDPDLDIVYWSIEVQSVSN